MNVAAHIMTYIYAKHFARNYHVRSQRKRKWATLLLDGIFENLFLYRFTLKD
jgi:hypothetical protein